MAAESGSEVYKTIFWGQGLSSMVTRGRLKSGLTQSTKKGILNHS